MHSADSITASAGSSSLNLSRKDASPSVSMMTEAPSFLTVPLSPMDVATRYTVGLKPTPWTVPRMTKRMGRQLSTAIN